MIKDKLIEQMLKSKGDSNNSIDLDAYARGLIDMYEMLNQGQTLHIDSVVVPKGTFYCWDGAVGEQVCEKQCVDCKNENEGKLQQ